MVPALRPMILPKPRHFTGFSVHMPVRWPSRRPSQCMVMHWAHRAPWNSSPRYLPFTTAWYHRLRISPRRGMAATWTMCRTSPGRCLLGRRCRVPLPLAAWMLCLH